MMRMYDPADDRREVLPWRDTTDDELVEAIASGELELLRVLRREAMTQRWMDGSHDAALRLLTIAHHAATAPGIRRRMAVMVSRVRRGLDVSRIPVDSEQWAARAMRHAADGGRETDVS